MKIMRKFMKFCRKALKNTMNCTAFPPSGMIPYDCNKVKQLTNNFN